MRILVTGASGFIGARLAARLEARGHQVVRAVRRPRGPGSAAADFARDIDPRDWLPRLAGIEAVVNAVGILREHGAQRFEHLHAKAPQALFAACVRAGVRKVLQISALGADEQATSRYHRSKKEADDFLARQPLAWIVAQPSLVFGEGGASASLFAGMAALPVIPVPGKGDQQVQPLHADDLVEALTALLERDDFDNRRVALVGPRPLGLRDMLLELRAALGLPPAPVLPVPLPLVRAGARLGAALPGLMLDPETLAMLLRGNTAPVADTRALLGRDPRPVREFVKGPAARALADRARLSWLLPVLRAAVALVWIVTGIVSLGVYPVEDSYALLARTGITGAAAPVALYGAALLDLAFGIGIYALRGGRARRWLWRAQIALIAGYTAIITVFLPEFWLHPYGPLLKNLPMLAAILLLHEFEEGARREERPWTT